jgi:hypothetical protein
LYSCFFFEEKDTMSLAARNVLCTSLRILFAFSSGRCGGLGKLRCRTAGSDDDRLGRRPSACSSTLHHANDSHRSLIGNDSKHDVLAVKVRCCGSRHEKLRAATRGEQGVRAEEEYRVMTMMMMLKVALSQKVPRQSLSSGELRRSLQDGWHTQTVHEVCNRHRVQGR